MTHRDVSDRLSDSATVRWQIVMMSLPAAEAPFWASLAD